MPSTIDKLTKKQEAAMKSHADKWIKIGLQTGETDWKTFDKYMPICYDKAGIKYPKNIVRVNSPLVGALAAAVAEAILKQNRGAVDDAVGGAVDGAVRGAVRDAVRGAVRGAVDDAVDDAVRDAVGGAVRGAVGGAVRGAVGGAVGDAVDDAVRDAVGGAVGDAVDDAVRDAVDDAVGGAVGDAVDGAVRGAVRGAVDDAVDGAVGDAVDDAVDDAVQTAINIAKKAGVAFSWHYWLPGQFGVGYWYYYGVAFVNFFFDICKLKLAKDIMERALAYRKICESVNYIWPNSDFVMVCARPTKIERNPRGRLHSLTGQAIEWPDGWGLYFLNGVKFEKDLYDKVVSGKMAVQEILAISNLEQRRAAYEIMDKTRMKELSNFQVLDEVSDDGFSNPMKLISFTLPGYNSPFYYLNCFCPTTKREYFIETRQTTCWKAKMNSFGLGEEIRFDMEF